jgi:glutaminase
MNIQSVIEEIYTKLKKVKTSGKNADYIPELKKVNPNLYAISIYTVSCETYNIGDIEHEFAIESASKVFSLALALKDKGIKGVAKMIGTQQTFSAFNSISAIEESSNHTINSFENGGAMATTSISYEKNQKKFEKKIFDNMSEFAGRKLTYSYPVYHSEITHIDHNLAIAYLLNSYGRFYGDVKSSVDVYTKQCSALVTSQDCAIMGATLANKGVNPKTGKKVIDKKYLPYILEHMSANGMYEYSETWMTDVGIPAKSGVGGVLILVVPGIMGIGIISPPLDKHGNSVKGIMTAQLLSKKLHLGIFNS